jgi:hypothetical protein
MSSQIFGNLFAAFVFQNYSLIGFYLIMLGFAGFGSLIFCFIGKLEVIPRGEESPLNVEEQKFETIEEI